MSTEIRALFADVIYEALINGKGYDKGLLEIYDDWFSEDEDPNITWNRIHDDLKYYVNSIILGIF